MITLLRRLFIKDYKNTSSPAVRAAHGTLGAVFGILTNLLIAGIKIAAAIFLASNSAWVFPMALIGDAVNNLFDMASSLATLIGVKISSKPADKEHPYGHERVEYIASMIISMLVLAAAVELFKESLDKVIDFHQNGIGISYDVFAMGALLASILLKLFQGYVNLSFAKIIDSKPLLETAKDSFFDVVLTTSILVSALLSSVLDWKFLDGYLGIAVSLFLFVQGILMLKESSSPLIGEATRRGYEDKIRKLVLEDKRIKGVHDILVHSYGPTKTFVSLHAELDSSTSFEEVHHIIDAVEKKISDEFNIQITIHPDPIQEDNDETSRIKTILREVLDSFDPDITFHDFRLAECKEHKAITFDILLPFEDKDRKDEIEIGIKSRLKTESSLYEVSIEFDSPMSE